MSFWCSETKSGAEAGADREAAGGVAAHSPRPVHGRHPQCRPGDGQPQPRLLATCVQVRNGIPALQAWSLLAMKVGRRCCTEEVDFHACQHFSGAQLLSHVRLFATPWTVAQQATLSMGFPRQEYSIGCHAFLQGIFLTQGSNPCLTHWQADSLPLSHQGMPCRLQ